MSRPLRLEYPGALWHLTNRGVNRCDIFEDDHDRELFIEMLAAVVTRYRWILHAWVQMTNHYHLVVETPETNLSRGMKDLEGKEGKEGQAHAFRFERHVRPRFEVTSIIESGAPGPADHQFGHSDSYPTP